MSTLETEVKKGELFVKQVLARLKGDDNEALAHKISRKSISAIDGQVASLTSLIVDQENTLEEAEEALNEAIYPITLPTNNKAYCDGIARAQAKVDAAQETLDQTKESIEFFKDILAKF